MAAFAFLGPVRLFARTQFFRFLAQAFATDDGRRLLAESIRGTHAEPRAFSSLTPYAAERPYPDLGRAAIAPPKHKPIFITARFRSGSTMLWNVFRHVPECRSYYEPLNERRWFDTAIRGERVDGTHRGVSDYWREYEGLSYLGRWYQQHWNDRHLYMDASVWEPNLFEYIEGLIAAAPCRAVLQFNRVDFRLEWLRHYFPSAVLIHLYRHPREQWCSTFLDGSSFPRTGTVAEFEPHDHFYLLAWARDLAYQFPFLDPQIARHPYELFYLIWKLSWIFGTRYTDASLCYETLCERPQRELLRLMRVAHVTAYDLGALQALIGSVSPPRWPAYASPEWFEEHEARAEEMLLRALGADSASPNPDDVNVRGIDAAAGYPVGRVPPDVWAVAPQGSRQR